MFESYAIHFLWGSHLSTSLWYNYVDKFVVKPTILYSCSLPSSLIQLTVILFSTYTTNAFVQLKYLSAIMAYQSKFPSLAQIRAWCTCITTIPAFTHGFMESLALKALPLLITHILDTYKAPQILLHSKSKSLQIVFTVFLHIYRTFFASYSK